MEFEHAFQQSEFMLAWQLLIAGTLLAPGIMLQRSDVYRVFAGTVASCVVTFGPMAGLIYVLYKVSHLF